MKRICAFVISLLAAVTSFAAVTTNFALDRRNEPLASTEASRDLGYDFHWAPGGAKVKIFDGSTLLTSGTSGVYSWSPTSCGAHNLSLQVLNSSGTVLETMNLTVSVLAHVKYTSKEAKAATCTEAGWTIEEKCSRCGEVLTVSQVVPRLPGVKITPEGKNVIRESTEVEISCLWEGAEIH